MTIEYDPHQNIDGNVQLDERHTINVSQPFRVVVPTHAPFYYSSLVVKSGNRVLTENVHYYVSHRYGTGTHQTAQLCYGSIWMIDKKIGGDISIDYHPMGINEATEEQIAAERARNASETPTDLDWEEIVGEKYFPPVNILFDRDVWNGETEIINSINALSEVISGGGWPYAKEDLRYPHVKVDPNATNIAPESDWSVTSAKFCVKKTLTFTGGLVNVELFADNYADFYVDGELKFQSTYPDISSEQVDIPAGEHTIAVIIRNGSGPSFTNFKIQEVGKSALFSDLTWRCAVLGDALSVEDAVRPIGGNSDVYGFIEDWYKAVKVVFETAPAHDHVTDTGNPHGDEYGWIHALERNGVAKNATKIFNKTLAELTAYVNSRAPTTADFSGKVRRSGGLLLGKMVMQNGFGLISKRGGVGHLIKIANGSVDTTTLADVVVTAGKTNASPIHLKAGNNALSLYPDARGLKYNGHEVLSKNTVTPHVPVADEAESGVVSRSTVTVTMSGKGVGGDKLVIEWQVPNPADAVYAMRPLATSFGSSKTHGAVPNLVKQVADVIPTKLTVAKAKINGKRLTNSVFLNPIDFGLDEVANISDKDLPISKAQQDHLDKYAVGAHEHKLGDFGYGNASKTEKGVVTLQPIGSSVSDALRSQDVRAEKDRLAGISEAIDELMPAGVITILRYGESGDAEISTVTTSGYVFTISQPKNYYCNGLHTIPATSLNLAELFPSMAEEQMIYLYANFINNAATYEVYDYPKAENDTLTQIGHILCTDAGIDSYRVKNVTRLGKFRELDEHRANESAHIEKPKDRNELGLGSFVNAEMRFNVARPTFQQIFDTWDRFSHGALATTAGEHKGRGDAQPANIAEEQSWTYNQANDSVVQPVNTGSFCGFISPTKHEKYLYDTILQSAAGDNDLIGVVLGFAVDDSGRERTLAWCAGQDGRFGAAVGSALCLDYNQTSQIITPIKPTARLPGNHNWSSTGPRRVKVHRDGDNYTVEQYAPSDTETVEEIFHFSILTGEWSSFVGGFKVQDGTLDDATVAALARFRGAQPFGYCCQSQPGSTYVNIQRPDVDGENFYASVPEQIEAVSPLGLIRVFKGRSTGLEGGTRADFISKLPAPVIKNYLGQTIAVPPERIVYYVCGDKWTMVCHLDATMLATAPL